MINSRQCCKVARMRGFQLTAAGIIIIFMCFVVAYVVTRQQIDADNILRNVQLCQSMLGLNQAKDGITFSSLTHADPYEMYTARVIGHINKVYLSLGCPKILGLK